jgi:hypothetical protein
VLPRNGEWEYAREFVSASPVLDEERREAFLQALQGLHEEQLAAARRDEEERRRQEEAIRRDVEQARRLRAENEARERRRLEEERGRRAEGGGSGGGGGKKVGAGMGGGEGGREKGAVTEGDFGVEITPTSSTPPLPRSDDSVRSDVGKAGRRPLPGVGTGGTGARRGGVTAGSGGNAVTAPTLMNRASMVLASLRSLVDEMSVAFRTNPYVLYRTLAFIVGLLLLLRRKRIRERIARILAVSWAKVKATAGMGTKVTYI